MYTCVVLVYSHTRYSSTRLLCTTSRGTTVLLVCLCCARRTRDVRARPLGGLGGRAGSPSRLWRQDRPASVSVLFVPRTGDHFFFGVLPGAGRGNRQPPTAAARHPPGFAMYIRAGPGVNRGGGEGGSWREGAAGMAAAPAARLAVAIPDNRVLNVMCCVAYQEQNTAAHRCGWRPGSGCGSWGAPPSSRSSWAWA